MLTVSRHLSERFHRTWLNRRSIMMNKVWKSMAHARILVTREYRERSGMAYVARTRTLHTFFRGEKTPLFSHYIFPGLVPLSVGMFECF